jgi:lipopolysaccharide transport system ATP-binding protein
VDNTYRRFAASPVSLKAGQSARAEFRFRIPALASGEYALSAAVASGTQGSHIVHHFLHEALIVRVHTADVLGGFVVVPMDSVDLKVEGG